MPPALHLALDWMYAGLHFEGPGGGSGKQGELDIEPSDRLQTLLMGLAFPFLQSEEVRPLTSDLGASYPSVSLTGRAQLQGEG